MYRPERVQNTYQILTQLLDDPTRYEAYFTTCVFPLDSSRYLVHYVQVLDKRGDDGDVRVQYGQGETWGDVDATLCRHHAPILHSNTCCFFHSVGVGYLILCHLNFSLMRVIRHSQDITSVVSGNGVQVRGC